MLLALAGGLFSSPAWSGELRFVPSIGISEDFTDNVYETAGYRRAEIETAVQPGGVLSYENSGSALKAAYSFVYRNYGRDSSDDDFTHVLALQGAFSVIENFLKVDISDTYSRVPLDIARDTRTESSFIRQTDQNTFTLSPYLLWRLSERYSLSAGFRYSNLSYTSGAGIDREETGAFADFSEIVSPQLSLTVGYVFNNTATDPLDYQDHNLMVGYRYEYADGSSLYGKLGNSWRRYSDGSTGSYLIWDAGISNRFRSLVVTLETQARYVQDPLVLSQRETSYSIRIAKTLQRSTVALAASYNEYEAKDAAVPHRYGVTVSLSADRQITPRLTGSVTLSGDRVTSRTDDDYPYRLASSLAFNYLLARDWKAGAVYTYVTYRNRVGDPEGAVDVNRMMFQIRKVF